MSNSRETVVRKFARVFTAAKPVRRTDYKGTRYRINLRIGIELAAQLQVLKLATGEDKNSYCERVLQDAISRDIAAERVKHDAEGWKALVASATKAVRT